MNKSLLVWLALILRSGPAMAGQHGPRAQSHRAQVAAHRQQQVQETAARKARQAIELKRLKNDRLVKAEELRKAKAMTPISRVGMSQKQLQEMIDNYHKANR